MTRHGGSALLWMSLVLGCAASPGLPDGGANEDGGRTEDDAGRSEADAGIAPECANSCGPELTATSDGARFTYAGETFDPQYTRAFRGPLGACGSGWVDFPGIFFHMGFHVPDAPACGRTIDLAAAGPDDFAIGFIHAVPGHGPISFEPKSGTVTLRTARLVEGDGTLAHVALSFDCTACVFESDATPGDTLALDGRLDVTF